jgi:hypothetical protein
MIGTCDRNLSKGQYAGAISGSTLSEPARHPITMMSGTKPQWRRSRPTWTALRLAAAKRAQASSASGLMAAAGGPDRWNIMLGATPRTAYWTALSAAAAWGRARPYSESNFADFPNVRGVVSESCVTQRRKVRHCPGGNVTAFFCVTEDGEFRD